MYYVDQEQIKRRLAFIDVLVQGCREAGSAPGPELLASLVQERLLHLAVETVTDIGSLLIDGFILRDASSYEDIVDILRDEQAIPAELHGALAELVRLRKPLVQDYMDWPRGATHPMVESLPAMLEQFRDSVQAFMARELAGF